MGRGIQEEEKWGMINCKVNGLEKGRGGREGHSDGGFGVLMVLLFYVWDLHVWTMATLSPQAQHNL